MNRYPTCLLIGLIATTAAAQESNLAIVPAKTHVLQYSVTTTAETKTDRKTKVDGEESTGGGRAGGGRVAGPVKSAQTIVFEEGPAGTNWREYTKAEASITRAGRDGADQTSKIEAAVAGKRLDIATEGGRVVFREAGKSASSLPAPITNGMPGALDLAALVPGKAVAVKSKFELGEGFAAALASVVHPIHAATPGGGRNSQGQRGQGRGQGRQGRGGGLGGPSTFNVTAQQILSSKKVTTKGTGELVAVEEKDGHKLATIAITAEITGNGTPTELGLGRGAGAGARRRGRGGDQGDAAQPADNGKASVTIKLTGKMVVDETDGRLASMDLDGTIKAHSESTRTMGRDGEQRKTETVESTDGSFQVKVTCLDKGVPVQPPKKEATKDASKDASKDADK